MARAYGSAEASTTGGQPAFTGAWLVPFTQDDGRATTTRLTIAPDFFFAPAFDFVLPFALLFDAACFRFGFCGARIEPRHLAEPQRHLYSSSSSGVVASVRS